MRIKVTTGVALCFAAIPMLLGFMLMFLFESFITGAMIAHDFIHKKRG